jgi:hypothetical protein
VYATAWIIRFSGTLTQGPNAGKSYSYATSWGGVLYQTREQAEAVAAKYRTLEPGITLKVLSRQFVGGQEGKFVETEVGSEPCTM